MFSGFSRRMKAKLDPPLESVKFFPGFWRIGGEAGHLNSFRSCSSWPASLAANRMDSSLMARASGKLNPPKLYVKRSTSFPMLLSRYGSNWTDFGFILLSVALIREKLCVFDLAVGISVPAEQCALFEISKLTCLKKPIAH